MRQKKTTITAKMARVDDSKGLRLRAEKIVRKKAGLSQKKIEAMQPDEIKQVLHELQVHQVELEMQNEDLRRTQKELDALRARYFDLYDLAPVGYLTVSEQGLILESNLAADTMLGWTRGTLAKQPLTRFIFKEDQDIYYPRRKKLFETRAPQTCELRMVKKASSHIWVFLDATLTNDAHGGPTFLVILTNITTLKLAEKGLRESEERFDQLAQQNLTFTWEVDAQGLYTYISHMSEAILGYRPEELVGRMYFYDLHPESAREAFKQASFAVFDRKESFRGLENYAQAKDGCIVWLSTNGIPLLNTNGTLRGYRGSDTNITERRQLDEMLRESEARYRLLAEHTKDIVWLMDMDTKPFYQSPSSEILRGYTTQELAALPLDKNFTPDSLKLAMEFLITEMPKIEADHGYDPVHILELEYYRKDGTTVWLENKFSVIRDESGKPVSILGEGRDITERKKAETALKESEDRFRALYDRSLYAVYIHDLEGNFIDANQYALDLLGHRRDEIKSINFGKLISPDQLPLAIETTMELIEGSKQSKITEYILKGKDSKYVHIETTATILYRESKPYAVLGIALDITKRKEIEAELIMSERKYKLLAENVTDVIWMADMNLNPTYISPSIYSMQGHTPEEAMNLSPEQRFTPESLAKINTIFAEVMEKEKKGIKLPDNIGTYEAEYYRKDGSTYWTETRVSFIRDQTEKAVAILGVTRDISLNKHMEQMLVKLANHDTLTGLPNRRLLSDRFGIAMANAQRYNKIFAIMSLDLDKFKVINDTMGHDFGDKLLISAAVRLSSSLRKGDTLARTGGDEFVILLADIDNDDIATKVAEKLLGDFRQPFIIDESSFNLTISIGISFFPDDGKELDELLKVSDKLLYIAKEKGRNRFAI